MGRLLGSDDLSRSTRVSTQAVPATTVNTPSTGILLVKPCLRLRVHQTVVRLWITFWRARSSHVASDSTLLSLFTFVSYRCLYLGHRHAMHHTVNRAWRTVAGQRPMPGRPHPSRACARRVVAGNPATRQTASRGGVTAAIPLSRHQAIKASFSRGDYVRIGGNFDSLAVSWQYTWLGRPN